MKSIQKRRSEQKDHKYPVLSDLDITEQTVKAHLASIYEKTKTGKRLGLALLINRGADS